MDSGGKGIYHTERRHIDYGLLKIMNVIAPVGIHITMVLQQTHLGAFFLSRGVVVVVIVTVPFIIRSGILERAARDCTVPSM